MISAWLNQQYLTEEYMQSMLLMPSTTGGCYTSNPLHFRVILETFISCSLSCTINELNNYSQDIAIAQFWRKPS